VRLHGLNTEPCDGLNEPPRSAARRFPQHAIGGSAARTLSHSRNIARGGKGHSADVCLLLGVRATHNRETLFKQINSRPTVFETLTGVKSDAKVAGKKRTLQEMTEKDGACVRAR
jgi:hypothetical protein